MKEIQLTNGGFALVDDQDFEYLNQWKWRQHKMGRGTYVDRQAKKREGLASRSVYMHRAILLVTDRKILVDHIDHNCLNNQRSNLRLCTKGQNGINKYSYRGMSKYKGVSWRKKQKMFAAQIRVNYKLIHLGFFDTEEQAAIAYNAAAVKHFAEFACLNII